MLAHNFSRSRNDSYVFFKHIPDGSLVYLLIYVDDMLIAAKNMSKTNRLKAQLGGEFEIKDLGDRKEDFGHGDSQG